MGSHRPTITPLHICHALFILAANHAYNYLKQLCHNFIMAVDHILNLPVHFPSLFGGTDPRSEHTVENQNGIRHTAKQSSNFEAHNIFRSFIYIPSLIPVASKNNT